ncbi:MAG: oxidoreductase [Flavobacteriales bacterium]|nr:oxidoreductase [Flavobacteriales bacterium]|tara:strand:- start:1643 stop:2617 length:975 start_codon:yes stop_codon:yes gene_type:complete
MKRFALIGAAGYIAPKHLQAIADVGGELLAAYDPSDSVGHLDSYFPQASFFTEFERFDRYLNKLSDLGKGVDYISICSPNYLHDSHIRYALRTGAHCICEKPLALRPWNIKGLTKASEKHGNQIFTILQLRLHKNVIALKKRVEDKLKENSNYVFDVDLTYITSRGNWYYASWKGDEEKSGGIATNIGVHFFDMLQWIFGEIENHQVYVRAHDRASGTIYFKNAKVRWFLSINAETLPEADKHSDARVHRSLSFDSWSFDFTDGFSELHNDSYEHILAGNGFSEEDAEPAIRMVHQIREAKLSPITEDAHELAFLPLSTHPFYS